MVYTCSVPFCKANYPSGPKVSTFGFPKEEVLKNKWIRAIHRKDFTPTKYSRVCEMHFDKTDIQWEGITLDSSTGKLVVAKRVIPRLKKGAVPTKLSDAPSYLSQNRTRRVSCVNKKEERQNHQLTQAISESLKSKELDDRKDSFVSLTELFDKIRSHLNPKWCVFKDASSITIGMIRKNPAPAITHSVVIAGDFKMRAFAASYELQKLGNHSLPLICNSTTVIRNILNSLEEMVQKTNSTPVIL